MRKVNMVLEKYLAQNDPNGQLACKAANNIKELLEQIDLSAEVVPENNLDMLTRLVKSLKNAELSQAEKGIISEIVSLEI